MSNRVPAGSVAVALGAAGLLLAWRIDQGDGDSGLFAALSLLVLATGALLVASAAGPVAVRATGGVLLLGSLAMVITHHFLWWWLPGSWATPVSLAALPVALAGLAVLLLAYGFSLAGLSGALGLLALACFGLTLVPYLGSSETSVFRVLGTALGGVAFTAGVAAAGTARERLAGWRPITAAVGVLAAAVTLYAGYDSYDVYATTAHHAVLVIATVGGAVSSLALGMVIGWPSIAGGHIGPGSSDHAVPGESGHATSGGSPESRPAPVEAPAGAAATPPSPEPAGPAVPAPTSTRTAPVETATAIPTRFPDRLQTVSAIVGLAIGLIALTKELVAAILALIG